MNIIAKMLIVLSVIGVISGGALSQVDNWAAPQIAAHKQKATEEAIKVVQAQTNDYKKVDAPFELYAVFDENGTSLGYAMPFEGNGFQGKIRLMFGINEDLSTVVGLSVLDQLETPGLGTKVTEDFFTQRFSNLSTNPDIVFIKGAAATQGNQVETITGATISSKAVIKIVDDGVKKLKEFKQGGA